MFFFFFHFNFQCTNTITNFVIFSLLFLYFSKKNGIWRLLFFAFYFVSISALVRIFLMGRTIMMVSDILWLRCMVSLQTIYLRAERFKYDEDYFYVCSCFVVTFGSIRINNLNWIERNC